MKVFTWSESGYAIALAITKAAVAANPPTTTVCHALRNGFDVVKAITS